MKLDTVIETIPLFSAVGRREGIHQSVAKEVASVFKGKTAAQLEALQLQIERKISGKPEGVDIGYWESLLSQLKGWCARFIVLCVLCRRFTLMLQVMFPHLLLRSSRIWFCSTCLAAWFKWQTKFFFFVFSAV
jgi:hypothetical protein